MNPNETPSEQAPPDRFLDAFDSVMKILSDIPTDRAMKELSNTTLRLTHTRQVVEIMSIYKQDLVRAVRLIERRERIHSRSIAAIIEADKTILDWVKQNPDYEVDIHAK